MEISTLRENFTKDLNEVSTKITFLTEELQRLSEYKLKLLGGLETLQVLDPVEIPTEEDQVEEELVEEPTENPE